jgi:hypothetical protein
MFLARWLRMPMWAVVAFPLLTHGVGVGLLGTPRDCFHVADQCDQHKRDSEPDQGGHGHAYGRVRPAVPAWAYSRRGDGDPRQLRHRWPWAGLLAGLLLLLRFGHGFSPGAMDRC